MILHAGRSLLRTLYLAAMIAAPAAAQEPASELRAGDLIRLRSVSIRTLQYGHVRTVAPESLRVALDIGGPPLAVPLHEVSWLEVSRGRPGLRQAGLWTGGIFAVMGGVLGYAAFRECPGGGLAATVCSGFAVDNGGQRALGVAGTAAALGAIGFAIGALSVPERWSVLIDRASTR